MGRRFEAAATTSTRPGVYGFAADADSFFSVISPACLAFDFIIIYAVIATAQSAISGAACAFSMPF